MSFELTCKLLQILPEQKGEGKNGPWIRQDFIVETLGEYPKKISMSAWGDIVKKVNEFGMQSLMRIFFRIESREYNGRWYTDVRPYKIENPGAQPSNGYVATQQPAMSNVSEMSAGDPMANMSKDDDDLPF